MKLLSVVAPTDTWRKHFKSILPEQCCSGKGKTAHVLKGRQREAQLNAGLESICWAKQIASVYSLDFDPLVKLCMLLHCISSKCPNSLVWTLQFFIVRFHFCAYLLSCCIPSSALYHAVHSDSVTVKNLI